VKIEAEPGQAALARFDERALARRASIEQVLALEDRRECASRLLRVDERLFAVTAARSNDERGLGPLPPQDGHSLHGRTLALLRRRPEAEEGAGGRTRRPRALAAADGTEAAKTADLVRRPERCLGHRRQGDKHPKLRLERECRRQLE
jgi:hypothetical protein